MPAISNTVWTPICAEDLRETDDEPGRCEYCGRADLRFIHLLENRRGDQLHVGCECARKLCGEYDPASEESKMRNRWARRSRWITRKWKRSKAGNQTLTVTIEDQELRVTIFKRGGWRYVVSDGIGKVFSPRSYSSDDAAKLAVFDVLE